MSKLYKVPLGSSITSLSNGRPVASGETVELSDQELKDEYNKSLIESGALIESLGEAEEPKLTRDQLVEQARELGVEGYSNMNMDQLKKAIAEGGE